MTNPTSGAQESVPAMLLDLSDYEVAMILRQLGAPRLPGFVPEVIIDANAEAILQGVLLARGLAAPDA